MSFFHFPIIIKSTDFDPSDYELYGPTLAANDQFIIAMKNRSGVTFSAISGYSTSSPSYCSVSYTSSSSPQLYATMLAIGRNGLAPSNINQFVFIVYSFNDTTTYLVVASITFSSCYLNTHHTATITNTSYPNYSVLGVNDDGTMAFYLSDANLYIQSLTSYQSSNWLPLILPYSVTLFKPAGIDLRDTWGVLGAYTQTYGYYSNLKATAYLINFAPCSTMFNSSSCFILSNPSTIPTPSIAWQSQYAPQSSPGGTDYNSLYAISISINNQGSVLVGVQFLNTVCLLSATSSSLSFLESRFESTIASMGFGKGVGWLDNTSAAILHNEYTMGYIQWISSMIEIYSITSSNPLSDTTSPYVSFPNSRQRLWSQLNERLVNSLAVPGTSSFIYMDLVGNVHVIRPSPLGYYVYTGDGIGKVNNTIYLAPILPCSSGTIKNQTASGKDLFRYCVLCPEGSFYSANTLNNTNQCTPCNTHTQYCPWGSTASLPISVLDIASQAPLYPQTPENDVFEDILLINMFNLDFSTSCLTKQPLFYALILIGIGCLVLLFMGILELTGKLKKHRRMLKIFLRQTDLIGEGEVKKNRRRHFYINIIFVF